MFETLIEEFAAVYDAPPAWIAAVIQTESGGNPNVKTWEPAVREYSYGLMQILGSTARGLGYSGDLNGLLDPATNIELGAKLIGQIHAHVGEDAAAMYSAYNSGNPESYLTSSQVAAHVAHFIGNLATIAESYVSDPVVQTAAAGSGGMLLLAAVFIWAWTNKNKVAA